MTTKINHLEKILQRMDSVLIAFSGGVDSTFLAKIARDVLDDDAIAATADSPSLDPNELHACKDLAQRIGIHHVIISTEEMKDPNYVTNPVNRCYYCKKELYTKLVLLATELHIATIINGINADDAHEYRPGMHAAHEYGIRSPLLEAELTKEEIRHHSKICDLPTHDKPSTPCLSSRIPHNTIITPQKLEQVSHAENYLRQTYHLHGNLRVRHYGDHARIETDPTTLTNLTSHINDIRATFTTFGFTTIDITTYTPPRKTLPVLN